MKNNPPQVGEKIKVTFLALLNQKISAIKRGGVSNYKSLEGRPKRFWMKKLNCRRFLTPSFL